MHENDTSIRCILLKIQSLIGIHMHHYKLKIRMNSNFCKKDTKKAYGYSL